jgi:hypothetical protein
LWSEFKWPSWWSLTARSSSTGTLYMPIVVMYRPIVFAVVLGIYLCITLFLKCAKLVLNHAH